MYTTNLSMAMAQEHQQDLRRQAQAARLARSAAPTARVGAPPPFSRISFAWNVWRPAHKFVIRAAEPTSLG